MKFVIRLVPFRYRLFLYDGVCVCVFVFCMCVRALQRCFEHMHYPRTILLNASCSHLSLSLSLSHSIYAGVPRMPR